MRHAPAVSPNWRYGVATPDRVSRLLSTAVRDQHEDWRDACLRARCAFEHWSRVSPELRADAFGAYRDALEEEERACAIYRALLEEIGERGGA